MASLARCRPLVRSAASARYLSTSAARCSTPPKPVTTSQLGEVPPPVVAEAPLSTPPPPPPPVLELEPDEPTPVARVRRPVGAFRGGLIGFLLGTSLVGGYGYFQLLDDYSQASSMLLLSVEELKASTEQMATQLQRVSQVEAELSELKKGASSKTDIEGLRKEYRKLLESEHLHGVELRARVWGIEQDLHALSKHAGKQLIDEHGIMTKDLALSLYGKEMKREHYVITLGYLDATRDLVEKKFAKVVSGKL